MSWYRISHVSRSLRSALADRGSKHRIYQSDTTVRKGRVFVYKKSTLRKWLQRELGYCLSTDRIFLNAICRMFLPRDYEPYLLKGGMSETIKNLKLKIAPIPCALWKANWAKRPKTRTYTFLKGITQQNHLPVSLKFDPFLGNTGFLGVGIFWRAYLMSPKD